MKWYLQAFRNAFDFKGRARRSEYWYFFLFNMLIIIPLIIIGLVAGDINPGRIDAIQNTVINLLGLYSLITVIPIISVSIRRLHDTGLSESWMSLHFLPFLGMLALLIFAMKDSEPHTNKWGRNPKAIDNEDIMEHLVDDID